MKKWEEKGETTRGIHGAWGGGSHAEVHGPSVVLRIIAMRDAEGTSKHVGETSEAAGGKRGSLNPIVDEKVDRSRKL